MIKLENENEILLWAVIQVETILKIKVGEEYTQTDYTDIHSEINHTIDQAMQKSAYQNIITECYGIVAITLTETETIKILEIGPYAQCCRMRTDYPHTGIDEN